MVLTTPQLNNVLNTLRDDFNTSPGEVFLLFLCNTANGEDQRGISAGIIEYAPKILTAMESHQSLSRVFFDKAKESVVRRCTKEVAELSLKVHNGHFNVKTMTEEQIRAYKVGEAVEKIHNAGLNPSTCAMTKGIQKDRVFPDPVGAKVFEYA
ncbi:hypothetical protein PC9H_010724 [Pleurotus ostreatus]|uniref:Uncharacterized protein n=1 Tax=Pleurotus ostreatus TaxID=5322 RepID=A0A8H6ZPA6_PLEOS|nr:uncharacterized protein PC9H_010724 [Pleurotus ostreatus]KAF7422568.1 hypothetical protein PC9H_010724 [Pleurotus ostreatus]